MKLHPDMYAVLRKLLEAATNLKLKLPWIQPSIRSESKEKSGD